MTDPMEKIVREALIKANVAFVEEEDIRALGLDFYLIDQGIHVEVKQFHTERINTQIQRAHNVIVIQGIEAAHYFASLLGAKP